MKVLYFFAILLTINLCHAKIYQNREKDVIDHDVVTFRFNQEPGLDCNVLLEDTITHIGGYLPDTEADLNGNCYIAGNKYYLDIFVDKKFDDVLWLDFSNTPASTPFISFPSSASEGSLSTFQHLTPSFSEENVNGITWKSCSEESSNAYWVYHGNVISLAYSGCVDYNCGGVNLYDYITTCDVNINQPTLRSDTCTTAELVTAGLTETNYFELTDTDVSIAQVFTPTCNGILESLNVEVSTFYTNGPVDIDIFEGIGWTEDQLLIKSFQHIITGLGTNNIPFLDTYVNADTKYTIRIKSPSYYNNFGFSVDENNPSNDIAFYSTSPLDAGASDAFDFLWTANFNSFTRTISSSKPDGWAFCGNSKGDSIIVTDSGNQEALRVYETGILDSVSSASSFITSSTSLNRWQTKCGVSENRISGFSTFVDLNGGTTCYFNIFNIDGSGNNYEVQLSPSNNCILPQAVHNSVDDIYYVTYTIILDGMFVVSYRVNNNALEVVTPAMRVEESDYSRRGSIARSDAENTNSVCWLNGNIDNGPGDVVCRLFDNNLQPTSSQFILGSSTGDSILVSANEAGQFIVSWKENSDMKISKFDTTASILFASASDVLGQMGPYFDSSAYISLRNDGICLVGYQTSSGYSLQVIDNHGNFLGTTTELNISHDQGPAVLLFKDGNALISWQSGSVKWEPYSIPCAL